MDEDLKEFKELFNKEMVERRCALRNILQRIENIKDFVEHDSSRSYSPFYAITYREKTFESTCEKIVRRGWEFTPEGLDKVTDLVGIRIITPYLDDIYTISDILHDQVEKTRPKNTMKIECIKDYILKEKPSGYRSYHMNMNTKVFSMTDAPPVWSPVEVQLRTQNQDVWASDEHRLVYKSTRPNEVVTMLLPALARLYYQQDLMKMATRDCDIRAALLASKEMGEIAAQVYSDLLPLLSEDDLANLGSMPIIKGAIFATGTC